MKKNREHLRKMDEESLERLGIRGVLDHDMFTDVRGRIYFTLGHLQPPGSAISLLKYVPDPGGSWIQRETGKRFRRSYWHQGIEAFIDGAKIVDEVSRSNDKGSPGRWMVHDEFLGARFLEVPLSKVEKYYFPEDRLREIMVSPLSDLDSLEGRVRALVVFLLDTCETLRGSFEGIGITGSILWKGHGERSDINLNVYGRDRCIALRDELFTMARSGTASCNKFGVKLKGFDKMPGVKIPGKGGAHLERKIKVVQEGFTPGIQIRWCLGRDEYPFGYGTEKYRDLHLVTVLVKVVDATYYIFYPAMAMVAAVGSGPAVDFDVRRVVSWDTRYTRLFQEGDIVEVTGMLQQVTTSKGESFSQILIGSGDFPGTERIVFHHLGISK